MDSRIKQENLCWPPSNVDKAISIRRLVTAGMKGEIASHYMRHHGSQRKTLYVESVEDVRINDDGGFYNVRFPTWLPEKEQDLIAKECRIRELPCEAYVRLGKLPAAYPLIWEERKKAMKAKDNYYNLADSKVLHEISQVRMDLQKKQNLDTVLLQDILKKHPLYFPPHDRRDAIYIRVLCLFQFECHLVKAKHPVATFVPIIPDSLVHAYLAKHDYKITVIRIASTAELVLRDNGGMYCVSLSSTVDEQVMEGIKHECYLRYLEFIPDLHECFEDGERYSELGSLLSKVSIVKPILQDSRVREEENIRDRETEHLCLLKTKWPTNDLKERIFVRGIAKLTEAQLEVGDKVVWKPSLEDQMVEKERIRLMIAYLEDNKVELPLHVSSKEELVERDDGGRYKVTYSEALPDDVKQGIILLAQSRHLECFAVPA